MISELVSKVHQEWIRKCCIQPGPPLERVARVAAPAKMRFCALLRAFARFCALCALPVRACIFHWSNIDNFEKELRAFV